MDLRSSGVEQRFESDVGAVSWTWNAESTCLMKQLPQTTGAPHSVM